MIGFHLSRSLQSFPKRLRGIKDQGPREYLLPTNSAPWPSYSLESAEQLDVKREAETGFFCISFLE